MAYGLSILDGWWKATWKGTGWSIDGTMAESKSICEGKLAVHNGACYSRCFTPSRRLQRSGAPDALNGSFFHTRMVGSTRTHLPGVEP